MTNQLPRALLSDVVLALSTGDTSGAVALLGPDNDPCRSAAVASYRAIVRYREGRHVEALKHLKDARHILETRFWDKTPESEAILQEAIGMLPAPDVPMPPALETILPQLARIRVLRFEALVLRKLGLDEDCAAVNDMLPSSARI